MGFVFECFPINFPILMSLEIRGGKAGDGDAHVRAQHPPAPSKV